MKRWWILKDRLRHGPFSAPEILDHLKNGRYDPNDFVAEEESQSVTQLSHRTIREVLGADAIVQPVKKVVEAAKPSVAAPVATARMSDADAVPRIRELISKIEAVELVESSSEKSVDANLQYQPVQHATPLGLFESLGGLFSKSKPILGGAIVLAVVVLFFSGSGEPDVAAVSPSQTRQPASDMRVQTPKARHGQVAGPRVNVPQMSKRSSDGFEARRVEADVSAAEEAESALTREDRAPAAVSNAGQRAAARRERLKKLRDAMAPAAPRGAIPGVSPDDEQSSYDDERQSAQDEEIDGQPPQVDNEEGGVPTDENHDSVDEGSDLEYQ